MKKVALLVTIAMFLGMTAVSGFAQDKAAPTATTDKKAPAKKAAAKTDGTKKAAAATTTDKKAPAKKAATKKAAPKKDATPDDKKAPAKKG
jgi:hypothetical protein